MLEKFRDMKLVTALHHKPYEEWLRILDLPTLKFGRFAAFSYNVFSLLCKIFSE